MTWTCTCSPDEYGCTCYKHKTPEPPKFKVGDIISDTHAPSVHGQIQRIGRSDDGWSYYVGYGVWLKESMSELADPKRVFGEPTPKFKVGDKVIHLGQVKYVKEIKGRILAGDKASSQVYWLESLVPDESYTEEAHIQPLVDNYCSHGR